MIAVRRDVLSFHPFRRSGNGVRVYLPVRFDKITNPHFSYQLVVRLNTNSSQPKYQLFRLPPLKFDAFARMLAKLLPGSRERTLH